MLVNTVMVNIYVKPKSRAATDLTANNTSVGNEIVKKKVAKSIYEGGYSENPSQTQKNGFLDPPKRVLVV